MLTGECTEDKSEIIKTEQGALWQDRYSKNWFWDYVAVFSSDLSPYAKLVRLYLASCADLDHQACPSLNMIAQGCSISKPTAIKALKELGEKGWLRKTMRKRANQEYETTIYTLKNPAGPQAYVCNQEDG